MQHWQKVKIEKGRYRNEQELVGYQETYPYYKAKPLYPALPETLHLFGQVLNNLQLLQKFYPLIKTGYKIFKLPQDRFDGVTEKDYPVVDRLESLKTALVTYVLIPKTLPRRRALRRHVGASVLRGSIGYYYTPDKTPILADLVYHSEHHVVSQVRTFTDPKSKNSTIYSNFGFYMTHNLIGGPRASHPIPWAHNTRYKKKFHLPSNLHSFLGFYFLNPPTHSSNNTNYPNNPTFLSSTFQGFERSLVGIHWDGQLEIIPTLPISSYEVYFGKNIKLEVNIIDPPDRAYRQAGYPNSPNLPNSPILFTPNLLTPEIKDLRTKIEATYWLDDSWQDFAPYVGKGRINIFIANKGNGFYPENYTIALWEDLCPLPAFGAILSFSKEYFYRVFRSIATFKKKFMNKKVTIIPDFPDLPDSHNLPNYQLQITNYKTIYGSFAPLVLNRKYLFNCDKEKIMLRLRKYGNFTSPMEMLGQETKTIAPYVREPKNVLFETENYIGNILFSGRYELSIGASLIDMTHTTKILSQSSAFKEPIKHAIILDSGSAARVVFAYKGKLYPLNIVAPGSRNKIGDPSGNFYSGLRIDI